MRRTSLASCPDDTLRVISTHADWESQLSLASTSKRMHALITSNLLAEATTTSCHVHAQTCALLDDLYPLAKRNQECYGHIDSKSVTQVEAKARLYMDKLEDVMQCASLIYACFHNNYSWKSRLPMLKEADRKLSSLEFLMSCWERDVMENEQQLL